MKSEDTIMNILEIDNIAGDEALCSNCPTPDGDCSDCIDLRIAQTQAEITGKIMKQEGIREVVEWLERCKKIKVPKYQLKEWGI